MSSNLFIRRKFPAKISVLFFVISVFGFSALSGFSKDADSKTEHQPIVEELTGLLEAKPELKKVLEESVRKAGRPDIQTLAAYCNFLDEWVTAIPNAKDWLPRRLDFYYIIANSPDNKLQKDPVFQQWVHKFVDNLGSFLDTPESAKSLETFYADPAYHIDDYMKAPGGWLTFNQFFARHVKPGKRPIDDPGNDRIIVSPADSVFQGQWKINENSEVTTKGLKWSVIKLLDGSPYQDRFKGGIFIHSYLSPHDYHRFHVPVRGVVKEVRNIPGKVVLDVFKKEDGSLAVRDEFGYQFTQE